MRQHTPGPWKANFPADQRGKVTITTEKPLFEGATLPVEVARIHGRLGHSGDAPCGNYRANANLLAASPDILAALKAAIAFIGQTQEYKTGHTGAGSIVAQGNGAIAKAEQQ